MIASKALYRLFALLFIFTSLELQAQSEILDQEEAKKAISFAEVERVPVAPNCDAEQANSALRKCLQVSILNHVAKNFKFPKEDRKAGVGGRIFVSFIVEKDATISTVEILRGVSETLDAEAVRVVKSIPIDQPAYHKGKPVRISYVLPINARLQ